jgi:hypothetical protein
MNEGLNRKAVYRIFRLVLDPQDKLNDQVVRVAAGMQLKHVLDPFEFEVTGFLEDAPAIIHSLIETLRQTNTSEVKMGLLETLRVLTGKMESNVCISTYCSLRWRWPLLTRLDCSSCRLHAPGALKVLGHHGHRPSYQ